MKQLGQYAAGPAPQVLVLMGNHEEQARELASSQSSQVNDEDPSCDFC